MRNYEDYYSPLTQRNGCNTLLIAAACGVREARTARTQGTAQLTSRLRARGKGIEGAARAPRAPRKLHH